MASRVRPLVMAGVTVATAATIVATAPAFLPTHDVAIGYSKPAVSSNYELAALTDITIQSIIDAYLNGYAGIISPWNPYFFPQTTSGKVFSTGVPGALFDVLNSAMGTPAPNQPNYFESGGSSPIYEAAQRAGVPWSTAVTAIEQLPQVVVGEIRSAASWIPKFNIGPVNLGGGILVTLYVTGSTPEGGFNYGAPGLPAVIGYLAAQLGSPVLSKSAPAPTLFAAISSEAPAGGNTPTVTSLAQDPAGTGRGGFKDPLAAPKITLGGVKDSLAPTGLDLPKVKLSDPGANIVKPGKTPDGTTTPDTTDNSGHKFEPRIRIGRHTKPEGNNTSGSTDQTSPGGTEAGSGAGGSSGGGSSS
jgi:uncharacterized membrane protein YgcG